MKEVVILSTGGTIEKSYNEFDGSLSNQGTIIQKEIVDQLRLPYTKVTLIGLFAKDSLHLTDYDRILLMKSIKLQLEKNCPIIILHGTDTMAKSAKAAFDTFKDLSVPIVFTGAMKPLGFTDSDAYQNVTEALIASKILAPGVYISFHNEIFPLPHVRKNPEKRTFEITQDS